MSALPSAEAAEFTPELNPKLDLMALKQAFQRSGRIHIPSVLTEETAARLFRALQQETAWSVATNNGPETLHFDGTTPEIRSTLQVNACHRARSGFAFIFDTHPLSWDGEPYCDLEHYFAKLVAFLNTPPFLSFVREVTGIEAIAWADAQATLYRPCDFLTAHEDIKAGRKRRIAYVLSMTPGWRPDWGGILQFIDERGHISESYVPMFNALNLFRVPMMHAVSQVSIFGGNRYSVTGWLHTR